MTPPAAQTALLARHEAASLPHPGRSTDPAHRVALRDMWQALWASRLLVWVVGVGYVLLDGPGPLRHAFRPAALGGGLGWIGRRLTAPAASWDASWYVSIAQHGYSAGAGPAGTARAAFFPLYPTVLGLVGSTGLPLVVAGIVVSLAAAAAALYGLHRITALEFAGDGPVRSREAARLAVLATALFPMAFFLSAVYSESIYLALSIGAFWFARQGRWPWAAVLGALAAATRSSGILLVVPLALLYLYGPHADREPDRPRGAGLAGALRPRYRVRVDVAWLVVVPAGLLAYMGYLEASGGEAMMPFQAQALWQRDFAGPFGAVASAAVAALEGLRQLVSMQRRIAFYPAGGHDPVIAAQHNVMLFVFLLAAVPAIVGVFRRLPVAYGAYVVAALAMPLSYPAPDQPLMSLPRFELVLFPLAMWAGAWLAERPRARAPVLAVFALGLCAFAAQFATWHWVA